MKTMKKVLAALVVMCMALSMPAFAAVAAETGEAINIYGETTSQQTLAAGTEYAVNAYGLGGTTLKIENANAYVIYDGTTYTAVEGVVTVEIAALMSPMMPVTFTLGNSGTEEIVVTLNFEVPVGSSGNPEVITTAGVYTAEISEGNTQGYFYTYVAETTGVLCVTVAPGLDANYEELGWMYVVNNLTSCAYGDNHYSDDETPVYAEYIEVTAGDELQFIVNTYNPNMMEPNPAGTVDVYVSYATGAEDAPITVQSNSFTQKLPASVTYNYAVRGVGGKVLTINNANVEVVYGGETYSANEEGVVEVLMASMPFYMSDGFVIVNKATEANAIAVTFEIPLGAYDNPEAIEEDGQYTAVIGAGAQPYYYTYVAPADGTVHVNVSAYDDEWNELGWTFTVNNITTGVYGEENNSAAETPVTDFAVEVAAGEKLQIMVNTFNPEDPWSNPAGNVYTYVSFEYPLGTENNPIGFESATSEITIPVGTTYYVTAFSGSTMTVTADGEFKLVFGEDEITSVNGVVSIDIPAGSGWGPSAAYFHIVTDAELTATVSHAYPEGHSANPDEIEAGEHTATFEAGAGEYYYNWTAEEDGKVTISVSSEGGWQYTVNNLTAYVYGDTQWSDSDPLMPSTTLDVKAGDVIEIKVVTYNPDDMWSTPAGTVTIDVDFVSAIEPTGDFSSTMIYVIVLLGVALVSAGFVAKKRFA